MSAAASSVNGGHPVGTVFVRLLLLGALLRAVLLVYGEWQDRTSTYSYTRICTL